MKQCLMSQTILYSILATLLCCISFPAFAKSKKPKIPSAEVRAQKKISLVWRAPTLTLFEKTIASGEVGMNVEAVLTAHATAFLNVQGGYAGNLGTFAGDGSVFRLGGGYRQYIGNVFYVAGGAGLRHANVGTIEQRSHEEYSSYDEQYYNAETSRIQSTSFGGNFSTGWLWQKSYLTIGVELFSVYQPFAVVRARSQSTDETVSDSGAAEGAKSLGRERDFSLPRLLVGVSF